MRLYRRGDVWWADFWHQGRRVRRSSGTVEEAAAREWADTLKASLWRESRLGERRSVSWDEAVLSWLAEKADKASLETDKDRLRWLSKRLQGKALDTITTRLLRELSALLVDSGLTNATANRYMAVVSGVLHHARDQEWLAAVPKIPYRAEPKRRIRFLKDEAQADKLIAELPKHVRPMSRFALATGLRRHNVTHLEWSSVDLKRRVAWYYPDEMKAGKPIRVPLNDDAMKVLKAQQKARDGREEGREWVFVGKGGDRPPTEIKTAWKTATKAAGVSGVRWHDLRHTWATWHVMQGTPLEVLKELGGWADLRMVLHYSHMADSHVDRFAGNAKPYQPEHLKAKKTA